MLNLLLSLILVLGEFYVPTRIVTAGQSVVAGRSHDGEDIQCDLPGAQQMRNVGSKLDGAGMCVFTSIEMAARWQGLDQIRGWRDWCARNYPGGGTPEKVDRLLKAWSRYRGIELPPYFQYEGPDLESFLARCDSTSRMACVTYGYGPRYGNATIAHMVCAAKYGSTFGVVLDNNFPGENSYEWMAPRELLKRISWPSGRGWLFVWLSPSPPPVPSAAATLRMTNPSKKNFTNPVPLLLNTPVCAATTASGQCPNGQCPIQPGEQPEHAPAHGWYAAGPGSIELYWHGERVGRLDPVHSLWQTQGMKHIVNLKETFGFAMEEEPQVRSVLASKPGDDLQTWLPEQSANHGMDWQPLDKPVCRLNGKEIDLEEAARTLRGGKKWQKQIPNDAVLNRLTIIGSEPKCQAVLRDFAALPRWRSSVIAQAFDPEHYLVKGFYPRVGDPTLYYTTAEGVPLGCSPDYTDGKEGMDRALAAAEKLRNPTSIDPRNAPDLAKIQISDPLTTRSNQSRDLIGLGVLLASFSSAATYILLRRPK